MCGPMAIGAAVGAGSSLLGIKDENKRIGAEIAAQNATKQNMVKSMNYEVANLSIEQRNQFDQAVQQLQNNSIDSIRNQGMIAAALGETNLQGRTTDAVMREVQGQDARVKDSIKDNHQRAWTSLQQNKEATIMQTQSSLDGMPKIQTPSAFSQILKVAGGAVSGATMGSNVGGMVSSAGGISGVTSSITGMFGKTGANTGMGNAAGGLKIR